MQIKITYSHLILGISIKEDWSKKQLSYLGVQRAYEAIGKDVDVADFQKFLDLQDAHVNELEFKFILNGGEILEKSAHKKEVRMPWGKHRGQKISDIPLGYLSWVTGLPDYGKIKWNIRKEIDKQLNKS